MHRKVANDYALILEFFPDWHKTQEMCGKYVDAYTMILKYDLNWFITPKMFKVISGNEIDFNNFHKPFTWHDTYRQQKAYKKRYLKR